MIGVLYIGALLGSHAAGTPAELPGIALGWPLLLHLERAAAALALVGIVALVGWRTLSGEFPTRMGQIEYAQRSADTTDDLQQHTMALAAKLEHLEKKLASRERGGGE